MLLLHLSDIHFRKEEIETPLDPNNHLRNELLLDAQRICKRLKKPPSAILISGDVAFAAHPEEYEFALVWLEKLVVSCGTTMESVFVVPGNHDVVRSMASRPSVQAYHQAIKSANSVSLDGVLRGLLTDPDASRTLYAPLDKFNLFAGQFFCDVSAPMRTIATKDLKLNDGSVLRLTGLNSAFVSSQADKLGDLFVDPACFQVPRERGVEHVAICHHPFNWLRNGDALRDHLNDVARIQLFGHDHTNRIELNRDSIRISASAAHPDRTEHGWEPGYNLIELEVINSGSERELRIRAHVRIWQSRPGQFIAKMDGEKDIWMHKISLDGWTALPAKATVEAVSEVSDISEAALPTIEPQVARSDPMDRLRNISVRFFKLTFSQKSAIAGKLELLEDEDLNQPDFERYRRVFLRARDRGLIEALDQEVSAATTSGVKPK
jgi:3',5'-cyclic AMP phosphodiesterase CpdA